MSSSCARERRRLIGGLRLLDLKLLERGMGLPADLIALGEQLALRQLLALERPEMKDRSERE